MRPHWIAALLTLVATASVPARAQTQFGSANHTVTVEVDVVSNIALTGTVVELQVEASHAAFSGDIFAENTATGLFWRINRPGRKVTVQTSLLSPLFALRIEPFNPTAGTAAGEIALDTTPRDFLRDIGRTTGSCTIRYLARLRAEEGFGTDLHNVTFTLVAQ